MRVRALGGVLACVFAGLPAWAASFDCAKSGTAVEKRICADAALSAADEAMAAAFAEAVKAAPAPLSLRREQARWLVETRNKASDLGKVMAERAMELRSLAARSREIAAPRVLASLAKECLSVLDDVDGDCKVEEAGVVKGAPGPKLHYQVQAYRKDDYQSAGAVVVLAETAPGQGIPLFWPGSDSAYFGAPLVFAHPAGALLDLPGNLDGTGHFSAETLYAWHGGAWREVDIESWAGAMGRRLPAGLEVWKGVYPDWKTMTAQTPLWRAGDGNCCPSGGMAYVNLGLRGEVVVLESMRVTKQMPPEYQH